MDPDPYEIITDPYKIIADPDPGDPKANGSGSGTLAKTTWYLFLVGGYLESY